MAICAVLASGRPLFREMPCPHVPPRGLFFRCPHQLEDDPALSSTIFQHRPRGWRQPSNIKIAHDDPKSSFLVDARRGVVDAAHFSEPMNLNAYQVAHENPAASRAQDRRAGPSQRPTPRVVTVAALPSRKGISSRVKSRDALERLSRELASALLSRDHNFRWAST